MICVRVAGVWIDWTSCERTQRAQARWTGRSVCTVGAGVAPLRHSCERVDRNSHERTQRAQKGDPVASSWCSLTALTRSVASTRVSRCGRSACGVIRRHPVNHASGFLHAPLGGAQDKLSQLRVRPIASTRGSGWPFSLWLHPQANQPLFVRSASRPRTFA